MELLQLKYFCAAAKFENFSKAAELFSIPQSSISKTIGNLEKELGCKLFTRAGKHVYLNDKGKAFLENADLALNSLQNGIATIHELSGAANENIRLAVWEGSKLLPDILSAFGKIYKSARFSLSQHSQTSKIQQDFDLCISSLPLFNDKLDYTPLITEKILLAVPADHPMANRSSVGLSDMHGDQYISLTSGKSLRRITDAFCSMHGFLPNVIFESDDPATVRCLIENGLGVAFIPTKTWKLQDTDKLKYLSIEGDDCKRTIAISWYKNGHLNPAAKEFRRFVIDWYRKL